MNTFMKSVMTLLFIGNFAFAAGGGEAAAPDVSNQKGKKASADWSYKRHKQVAQVYPGHPVQKDPVTRPEKVQLLNPAFLAKVTGPAVKLEWNPAGRAQHYHVQVSKDAGFNNQSMYVADDKWVSGTTFEVTNLEPGVKYFWRVAAQNKDQEAMYSKSLFVNSAFEVQ